MAPTQLLLEGPAIEPLLQRVRSEHGPDVRIIKAERVRVGGFVGFFAREQFEVTVEVGASGFSELLQAAASPAAPAPAARTLAVPEGLDALLAAAEQAERAERAERTERAGRTAAPPVTPPALAAPAEAAPEAAPVPAPEVAPEVAPEAASAPAAAVEPPAATPVAGLPAATPLWAQVAAEHSALAAVLPETPVLRATEPGPSTGPATGARPDAQPAAQLADRPAEQPPREPEPEEPRPAQDVVPADGPVPGPAPATRRARHRSTPAPPPTPVPPSVPTPRQHGADPRPEHLGERLAGLGVPPRWLGDLPPDRTQALRSLAERIAATPAQSLRRATLATSPVVVVLADLDGALPVARSLALGLGLDAAEVVVMHRRVPGAPRDRCLPARADLLAEVDRARRRRRALVLVLPAPVGAAPAASAALADTLLLLRPDEVWAVVDATRRLEDSEAWLGALVGERGVDAVALTNVDATCAPAAGLDLPAPVVLLGDRPATPEAWVSLLAARLVQQDLA